MLPSKALPGPNMNNMQTYSTWHLENGLHSTFVSMKWMWKKGTAMHLRFNVDSAQHGKADELLGQRKGAVKRDSVVMVPGWNNTFLHCSG